MRHPTAWPAGTSRVKGQFWWDGAVWPIQGCPHWILRTFLDIHLQGHPPHKASRKVRWVWKFVPPAILPEKNLQTPNLSPALCLTVSEGRTRELNRTCHAALTSLVTSVNSTAIYKWVSKPDSPLLPQHLPVPTWKRFLNFSVNEQLWNTTW